MRGIPFCVSFIFFFCAFVAFLVPACIDIDYGSETDLAEARDRAYVFCNSTRCIQNCNQFNTQMEVFVKNTRDVLKYVCAKTCLDNRCSGFTQGSEICPDTCYDAWSTYDHIRDHTGEDGQCRYNRGAGFLSAAILCITACICIVAHQDSRNSRTVHVEIQ